MLEKVSDVTIAEAIIKAAPEKVWENMITFAVVPPYAVRPQNDADMLRIVYDYIKRCADGSALILISHIFDVPFDATNPNYQELNNLKGEVTTGDLFLINVIRRRESDLLLMTKKAQKSLATVQLVAMIILLIAALKIISKLFKE
jgi:hypothetical protein